MLGNAALVYSELGRIDEAIVLDERSIETDPLHPVIHSNVASLYVFQGRLEEAERHCRESLALMPDLFVVYNHLGAIHLLRAKVEDARFAWAKANEMGGLGDLDRLASEAQLEHTAGNTEASRRAAEELENRFGADAPTTCAKVRAWRGDTDAAFAWLDRALAARDPTLASIKADYLLRPLHTDPRWNELLKKIGLPTG